LGIVQGLTEFLPVSSSGHLVLLQRVLGIEEGALFFTIMLHMGTLLSVILVFWKDIWEIIRKPFDKMTALLVAATIPTVVIALLFKDAVEEAFRSAATLGIGFIVTGVILWTVDSLKPGQRKLKEMSWKGAVFIGMAQGLALFPAISRSGSTLAAGLALKLNRKSAARFSFLMSIPAILGSVIYQMKDVMNSGLEIDVIPVAVGTIAAAASGFLAIKFMLDMISKRSLKIFSVYVFVLGALVLVDQMVLKIFI